MSKEPDARPPDVTGHHGPGWRPWAGVEALKHSFEKGLLCDGGADGGKRGAHTQGWRTE